MDKIQRQILENQRAIMVAIRDLIEEYRKKECFCEELDVDFCSKCNNPVKDQRPCIVCKIIKDLIKFMEDSN